MHMRPPALATRAGRLGATSSLQKPRARSPEKPPEPFQGPAAHALDPPGSAGGGAPSPFCLRNASALPEAARRQATPGARRLAAPTGPPSPPEDAGPRDAPGLCSSPATAVASVLAPPPQAPRRLDGPRAPLSAPPCDLPGVREVRAPRNGPLPGPRGDTLASASGPPLDPPLRLLALPARLPVSPLWRRPVPPDPDPSEAQHAEAYGPGRRSQPERPWAPRRRLPRGAPRVAARRPPSAA